MRRIYYALLFSFACALSAQTAPPSQPIQQAIEEFHIQAADLGLLSGSSSQTVAQARPSRLVWHGRIYENFRNDFLDAVPHEIAQRGGERGLLRRNQFGFNVSGPVLIPKLYNGARRTFFSFSYEGMRERIGRTELETIPTMAERTGDWSGVVDQAGQMLAIFDPLTTAPNPAFDPSLPVSSNNLQYNRLPFPGNRIPDNRLDAVARRALAFYPSPNASVGPFNRNNYFVVSPETNRADGFLATVDHNIGDRHRLSVDVGYSNGLEGSAALFPTIADPENAPEDIADREIGIEHIYTISPVTINTLQFEASTFQSINRTRLDETGNPFPRYEFWPYEPMGRFNPISRDARNFFELENTLSLRRDTHRLTLGVDINRIQAHAYRGRVPSGRFRFSDGLTSLPGINNTGHPFASFLLGGAESAERSVVVSPSYFRGWQFRFTANNQWEITPSLTLTLGANLEIFTPRVEEFDRQSNISLAAVNPENGRPGALVVAGLNGQGRAFQSNFIKVEPNAALAWNMFGRSSTVLRMYYSRRYQAPQIRPGQFGTQAFNGTPTWLSSNPQLTPAVVLAQGLSGGHVFPDLRPEGANGTVADFIDTSGRQPTMQNFGLRIERQLPGRLLLSVEAEHQSGRDAFVDERVVNLNAIPLSALGYRDQLNDLEFNRSLRPYPQYEGFDFNNSYPDGRYQRDGASIRLEKRTSGGLSLTASYEFSKAMDDSSGRVQDYFNRRNEWSLSSFNRPHRVSLTYMYELPIGPNKAFLNDTDWRRHLVEGWTLSGTTNWNSGSPLMLEPRFNNTGGVVNSLRVNVVPGVDPHVADPSPVLWFNPAAFAQPDDFTIGNASRTHPTLRSPSFQMHNLALNKRFSVMADRTLEFSLSAFNFPNHANLNQPDTEIGPESAPNVNAGRIIGSRGGRVIQLGLRFSF